MKKKFSVFRSQVSPRLFVYLGACLLVIAVGMAGCGDNNEGQTTETWETSSISIPPSEVTQDDPPQPQPETTSDDLSGTEELRTHYEALIAELRAELLQEREDRYISDFEYKQRLEELEKALDAWEKVTVPDSTPTVAPLETHPSETTTPPAEETEPPKKPADSAVFNYRLENSEVIITGYTGTAEIVSVPSIIDGHPVTAIDDYAFQNTSVVSVILPGTVTSVGWFAFYGCFSLEIISLPASVTSIQYAAFDGCPRLTILCPADSYAAKYAVSFGLKHEYV